MSSEPLPWGDSEPVSRSGSTRRHVGRRLIQHQEDDCRRCRGCVRVCPAGAIGVSEAGTLVIHERCVSCGACVKECGFRGHVVRDDTAAVRALLHGGGPVVAVLATEAVAALHPKTTRDLECALEAMGFHAVETTLLGEEMVASEFERLVVGREHMPAIRSTCPVVVSWVLRFHPKLTGALVPLVPPYIAQAKLVKSLYPEGTVVVYVSPCFARKDDCSDPQYGGAVDAAIDFAELEELLADAPPLAPGVEPPGARRPAPLKEVSLTDGFPRSFVECGGDSRVDTAVVRGLEPLDRLLDAIADGEAAPSLVDTLHCDGCIDGPTVAPQLSVHAKRTIAVAHGEASRSAASVGCRRLLAYLPRPDLRRSFTASPVMTVVPSPEEVDRILAEGGVASRDEALDCGACGQRTCADHAVAIAQGRSTWDMCWPRQAERLEASLAALAEAATTDPLTGLPNRREFEARLREEVERVNRYGGELSLLMVDVDAFKGINDTYGHRVGDSVLRSIGAIIPKVLRGTDLPSRYGGDEFGVLLPGIGKTAAFAVAEKLRSAVRAISVGGSGADGVSRVTLSVGVSAISGAGVEPDRLLEAADRALYRAKENGRDRVEIAPD